MGCFNLFTAVMLHLFTFMPVLYIQWRTSLLTLHPDKVFIFGPEMKSANWNPWQRNITLLQLYYQRAEIFAWCQIWYVFQLFMFTLPVCAIRRAHFWTRWI